MTDLLFNFFKEKTPFLLLYIKMKYNRASFEENGGKTKNKKHN